MEQPLIIANWKSHMTAKEALVWLSEMKETLQSTQKQVVVCPPFTLLSLLHQQLLPTQLGAQNISPFSKGAYTGEIHGEQIKEFADYVIIGHSERREYFHEDDDILSKKVAMAKSVGLIPVYCVQGVDTVVPKEVAIVAYEPIWAIGSGKAESPEHANEVAKTIKSKTAVEKVLYGGSVDGANVESFTKMSDLSGVLVGGASLDPQKFSQLISHA
jgi:triosephosphate isomerase (TIM)